jgi:hypothetical protein
MTALPPNDLQDIPNWIREQFNSELDIIENEYAIWFKKKNLRLRNMYSPELWRNDWVTWKKELFENELTQEIRDKAENKMQELHNLYVTLFEGR